MLNGSTLNCLVFSFYEQKEKGISHRVCNFTEVSPFIETGETLSLCYDLALWALQTYLVLLVVKLRVFVYNEGHLQRIGACLVLTH